MNSQITKEYLRQALVAGIKSTIEKGERQFTVEIGNGWMHSCILKQGGPVGKPGDPDYVEKLADYYLPELESAAADAASGLLKVGGCVESCCSDNFTDTVENFQETDTVDRERRAGDQRSDRP